MSLFRSTFIALSNHSGLRRVVERSLVGRKLSHRFVPGTEVDDAILAALQLNAKGVSVTLDALGENVCEEAQAVRAAKTYYAILDSIVRLRLDANVSLKLTQMGLDLSNDIAEHLVGQLAEKATSAGSFLRIDMEGSSYTDATIQMVRRIHQAHRGIGVVVQAYLRRSEEDVRRLLQDRIRIRLCKGAYQEPATLAFPEKANVDANYIRLAKMLLTSGIFHGLATHDVAIICEMKCFVDRMGIPPSCFEFQMLYGIRRDLQESLVRDGYRVLVYVPFGKEWYPYFMRRLAERPANALFLAKNLTR